MYGAYTLAFIGTLLLSTSHFIKHRGMLFLIVIQALVFCVDQVVSKGGSSSKIAFLSFTVAETDFQNIPTRTAI